MNETEFRILFHAKLCDLADLVLHYHNPCQAIRGACLVADPNPCCIRTRFKRMDEDKTCFFMEENRCTFPNIECKVWLCKIAQAEVNPQCQQTLTLLEGLAKVYGLTNER